MRYTVDCEFDGHEGPLISIAVVAPDGSGFYGVTSHEPLDPWVDENVMPILDEAVPYHKLWATFGDVAAIRRGLKSFLKKDEHPVFIADSPVDIARIASALSTGDDGKWASAEFPRIGFEVYNVDCWPCSLDPKLQHNAYWDAVALWEKIRE